MKLLCKLGFHKYDTPVEEFGVGMSDNQGTLCRQCVRCLDFICRPSKLEKDK